MQIYNFSFNCYQRRFQQPLQTRHGLWQIREGIIIELEDKLGRKSQGEIAPIPWFGSETIAEALSFCQQLPNRLSEQEIKTIPEHLPSCQFAFESALMPQLTPLERMNLCGLLAAGEKCLEQVSSLLQQGYLTLKWKIGVFPLETELAIFEQLIEHLPCTAKLRLDANGALTVDTAKIWLEKCEKYPQIEFLEQPLDLSEFGLLLTLSQNYQTAIALDESVATLRQIQTCYDQGWQGIFVIKPSIAGSPEQLKQFFQQYKVDAVFSSALETDIGRNAALNLALELNPMTINPDRAFGFGISHWFVD